MKRNSRFFCVVFLIALAFVGNSCGAPESVSKQTNPTTVSLGDWMLYFDIGSDEIPINIEFALNETGLLVANVVNAKEIILIEKITLDKDSMIFEMPLFNSKFFTKIHSKDSLTGYWINYNKSADYKIPVRIVSGKKPRFTGGDRAVSLKDRWRVTFNPEKKEDSYDAIGVFHTQEGAGIAGTFLTETGDYRFLDGNIINDSLKLSCFDGAHLFLFKARVQGDSLTGGKFHSGNHYLGLWNGVANNDYELRDPNDITNIINNKSWRDVKVRSVDNKELALGEMNLENKVSIIQIMGTWCPNCVDESIYFKELHQKYSDAGLKIVPVCFEKEHLAFDLMTRFKERLGLPYSIYLGGKLSKNEAVKVFPMLNDIISFPTSMIIDKNGVVRKIHTGFYGPSTGDYYTNYTKEMDSFISTLLKE
ncbi:MAG: thiol-disulfide isomerase/thioredoxin [Ulvibacter sp.]|jgi:thiol-disulfide isomerase/thioredoxin